MVKQSFKQDEQFFGVNEFKECCEKLSSATVLINQSEADKILQEKKNIIGNVDIQRRICRAFNVSNTKPNDR